MLSSMRDSIQYAVAYFLECGVSGGCTSRPLRVEAIGGARVLGATHASNQVDRTGIEAAFFEDVVLQVNADDLPDHQASARRLGPKINDPVELALEADWRLRHLWRAHHLRRPRGQFRQRDFV